VEQRFGSERRFAIGGRIHSSFVPISDLGLEDLESSLATFLLHKDYRDYYESDGWSVFATAAPTSAPLTLRLSYRDEDHRFAPVQSPWTLQRNDQPWRPQPLVAEGDLRMLEGEVVFDARNDESDPSDGWLLRARAVRGLDGALAIPEHLEVATDPVTAVPRRPFPTDFTSGLVDLRRYARLGPDSDLGLRIMLAGSVDGDPLPPQFQQALGGEGSLPGYGLFTQDCHARSRLYSVRRGEEDRALDESVFGSYGCDRAALVQFEFRRRLGFGVDFGPDDDEEDWEDWEWYPTMDLSPSWAFFFDVGRGWSRSAPELDTSGVSDVGLGFFLGDLRLYFAKPLRGEQRDLNFFVRLHRRF
jgi:hypothetical protein